LQPLDQGITHAVSALKVATGAANIYQQHDANINISEAIHMLSAAKKTSSAATIVYGFHKPGITPQDKCKIESGSDVNVVKIGNICVKN
jgi:hypothetical protein